MTNEVSNDTPGDAPSEAPSETPSAPGAPSPLGTWVRKNRQTVIIAAAVVVVVVVAIISFAVSGKKSSSSTTTTVPASQIADQTSAPLSADGLRTLVKALGHPVYWAGEVPGFTYILVTQGGKAIVKYLPAGKDPALASANLQLGNYPVANAYDVTKAAGQEAGSKSENNADGSVIAYSDARPTNVYIAFPKSNVQVEVFDPTPGSALQWAKSGKIQLVVAG